MPFIVAIEKKKVIFKLIGAFQVLKNTIEEIRKELNTRYNHNLPSGIFDVFRLIDHIINRFNQWWTEKTLLGNDDAEIFLECLDNKLDELEEMLLEIDKEFNK